MSCHILLSTSAERLKITLMLFSSAPVYGLFQNLVCQTWKHKEYGTLCKDVKCIAIYLALHIPNAAVRGLVSQNFAL